jgi:molybdopterin adenylyltransferase
MVTTPTATQTVTKPMTSNTVPAAADRAAAAAAAVVDTPLVIGLVSISDRASGGVYQDQGLPALQDWLARALTTPFRVETRLIADEQPQIEATLTELADTVRCHLILTTGGTGPSRRDVTPEATKAVGTKEMPGFGEQMRQISLHFVPTAILSRQTAVIRESADHAALILNLPGQPKAIAETLGGLKDADGATLVGGIFAAVPYCIDLIGGPYMETAPAVCKAFRPKSAIRPAQGQA